MTWKPSWKATMAGLATAVALSASSVAVALDTPEPPPRKTPIIGTITPDPNKWGQIEFVYVREYPFDGTPESAIKKPPLGPTSKTIFQSPEGTPELPVGQLIHLEYRPTFDSKLPELGRVSHYHEFWEWGYTLKGDSIMPEPVHPLQKNGMYYRKKEGGWLTRPPYSLHSGSWVTGAMRNQLPYNLIIFEEGDGHVIDVGTKEGEPGKYRGRDGKGPPPGTVGDWRKVERFTRPWLVDSVRDLDWEDDIEVPGRFVKWLDDDMYHGFRAQLIKIPPGWQPPPEWKKTYFERANRLRYMVWGEMNVWVFKDPSDPGTPYQVKEDYFIYQPPRAIWGYGDGPVTDRGAIFLEVTYARGLKHDGGGPIEKPKRL
ncbi:MAG: hypothetical protein C0P74_007900 [Gammaproteobacteria bacterium]